MKCEGLGERIPVRIIEGAERAAVLRARRSDADSSERILLACQRAFPAAAQVRLVWGAGITAAGHREPVSSREQRTTWTVRERFGAEFQCERENATAPCLPLRPMTLRFNAPVPRALALALRLTSAQGEVRLPVAEGDETATVNAVRFAAPLPENTRFTLTVPDALRDDAGRPLANRGSFPLKVATGPMPPLAKFAGAPFGILEAAVDGDTPTLLPVTLRQVQADLVGAASGGQVRIKRLDAAISDVELLRWIGRLRADHDDQFKTRAKPLLDKEAGVQRAELPQLKNGTPRATEVIGVPLPQRGYHIVEIESRILGNALLASRLPMYARTGALVTDLGVHFKRGRSSSLVWVTTLSRGRPVAGARVVVNDCRGQPVWTGSTDTDGIAHIERGFASELEQGDEGHRCLDEEGLFVTARLHGDLAFVFSDWKRGIEPWRFNLPTAYAGDLSPTRQAHTVFDRTLLRAGETVSMKHFLRMETARGLALPAIENLPDSVVLTHVGSGAETRLPLSWPQGARSSENQWKIPSTATLGAYDVALEQKAGKDGDSRRIGSGSFRVEAFRVPLVDARLAAPAGVQVAPSKLAFSAQLNALAGGPMAAAPVTLTALLQSASISFADYEDFDFSRGSRRYVDEGDPDDARSRLVADKLAATTDPQGAATLTIDKLPPLTGPAELIAELGFDDPNGERQTVAQRLRLWPAAIAVGLRIPGWAASKGQVGLTAVVLNTEGRPVKGKAVEVSARLHKHYSVRKRIVGGFYAYDNREEVQELGSVCKATSDAQGRVSCNLQLDAVGQVELVASAVDDAGRKAEASSSIWISGETAWWFEQGNDDRIDVLPEQRELEPGQTARLQVRMPFSQATALVTVEREGILDSRVMQLSGRQPIIELPIPQGASASDAAWAPNVMVGVLVLRGRLREAPWWSAFTWGWRSPREWWQAFRYENKDYRAPSAVVDLSKPSFKFGVAQLTIGRAAQRLDVAVRTDRPDYPVRQTVHAVVRVTHDGKPLAGTQIAFAAVDEGLLALQPNTSWQLLEGLLQSRPWGVETATAQGEIVGRRHYGRKALPPGGGGGHNPTRELFDTLLLWRGTVVLDTDGQAQIDVPLNDSLTRFRLVAIADALPEGKPQMFGSGSTTVRVTQDLQMLPGLPLLARGGDRFDAPFTLRNTTARAMKVRAMLTGTSTAARIEGRPQELMLAAGAAQEVHWNVQIPHAIDRVEWLATVDEIGADSRGAAKGAASAVHDRLRRVMPVVPAVPVRVWQAALMPVDGSASVPVAAPAGALPDTGGIAATLMPRLAGKLPGVHRYFETYPYSCLEQKASRSIGLRDAAAWASLRDEAAGYLDSDGLAAYFPIEPGHAPRGSDRLTAYLLSASSAAGWTWPDTTRDAMLGGLTAFVEGRIERRFQSPRPDLAVRKLAALEALSRYGRVLPRMLGSVEWTPAVWPTSALLDAWNLYRRLPQLPERATRLDEVQRLVKSRLIAGGTTLGFSTEAEDDWWWLMESADANATKLLLAAVESPEWKEQVPHLLTGALARQRRGAWQTTPANLWGVLALEQFAKTFEAVPTAGRTTLQLGPVSRRQDWMSQPDGSTQLLPWPPQPALLNATHEGAGRPWLTMQTLAAVPLTAAQSAGYRITRTVTPVDGAGNGTTNGRASGWKRGDVMRVRLEIDATTDMAWVALSDPVPAGATLLGSGLGRDSTIATQGQKQQGHGLLAYIERGAGTWRAYYEWLPRGHHLVEYTLRLNASGRFGLPPTRAEALYAPETFGETPNAVLVVQP